MAKYEVTLTQVKSIVVTVEGETSDKAVHDARKLMGNPETHFKNRIGAVVVAGVREIKNGTVDRSD